MVACICGLSTWEAKAEEPQVGGDASKRQLAPRRKPTTDRSENTTAVSLETNCVFLGLLRAVRVRVVHRSRNDVQTAASPTSSEQG